MNPLEVWYAIPSASAANCARTLPEWRARGYRIALLQDRDKRFDAPAEVIVAPFERYPGYGRAINHLIHEVVPAGAPIVVTGGDDMYPDMAHSAAEIAEQFLARFPDTFGVMQPTGDDYGNTRNICGSPWIGREFARRVYAGQGPYCRDYFQLYEDQELHDVAEKLGALWKRPDLSHFHEHWQRAAADARPPAYLEASLSREAQSRAIYQRRRDGGFPGHEPVPAPGRGMKLVGMMPARNEAWIIGLSLSVALMYCDEMIVSDHGSTDRTLDVIMEISRRHPGRVHVVADESPDWSEMAIREVLLRSARERGATHGALIDADEIISANLVHRAQELYARGCPAGFALRLPMISPWGGVDRHRIDAGFKLGLWAGYAIDARTRYAAPADGYEMHGRLPGRLKELALDVEGGVLHMQFCSLRRLRAKAVWYKLNEVLRYGRGVPPAKLNEQYDWAIAPGETAPMPEAWWGPYRELAARYLDLNAEPWHEAEVRRLAREHGMDRFAGIDFLGVLEPGADRIAA